MSYAGILQTLQDRIMDATTDEYYDDLAIAKPSNVIPWENNATQWDEADYPQPPRPYVAVDFADMGWTQAEGRRAGTVEMSVKVVTDNFHQGREDSEDLPDYVAALAYAEHIEKLIDGFGGIHTTGFQRPVFGKNLIISTIRISYSLQVQRGRLPWSPSV